VGGVSKRDLYTLEHTVNIPQHVAIPETQGAIAARRQPTRPCLVASSMIAHTVLPAVKLDNQSSGRAMEVRHIRPDGLLPAESDSAELLVA
jgi:hypothetical protein